MAELWTQADIDTLKAAIAGGVKRVSYDGPPKREVEYHSMSQMATELAKMVRVVAGTSTPSRRLAKTSKGYR